MSKHTQCKKKNFLIKELHKMAVCANCGDEHCDARCQQGPPRIALPKVKYDKVGDKESLRRERDRDLDLCAFNGDGLETFLKCNMPKRTHPAELAAFLMHILSKTECYGITPVTLCVVQRLAWICNARDDVTLETVAQNVAIAMREPNATERLLTAIRYVLTQGYIHTTTNEK
jgi:hypothetical protein